MLYFRLLKTITIKFLNQLYRIRENINKNKYLEDEIK